MIKKLLHILKWFILSIIGIIIVFIAYYLVVTKIDEPEIDKQLIRYDELKKVNDTTYTYQDSWLRKNRFGLWEMYISGSAEELGIKNGILSQHLIKKQENAFVSQIKEMIPSASYLNFLKYITYYMNRKLVDYIPAEYLQEIKAISLFASNEFEFIGSNYHRQLNYHAAHDIGHAMQNLHLVECTAFGAWDTRTSDSGLLIGRNFDFFVGEEFAKNKIVLFVKPDKGYPFASITWGGMIGVVSGMNNQGLSITLNSAKGDIPLTARTPVSIIAREILQYASTIEQAYAIAKTRPSFVAESFMIGSAVDGKAAIIEKTPDTTILYFSNSDHIVLTNHFQSKVLKNTIINRENMAGNVTTYRFSRVEELLIKQRTYNEHDFSGILRDTKGLKGVDIGLGNEGAINQLIAHHSIIFKPMKNIFWISSSPYQLGAYAAYQLDSLFANAKPFVNDITQLMIPADTVFLKEKYFSFIQFKEWVNQLENHKEFDIERFVKSNPKYFYTYELSGDYLAHKGEWEKAKIYYEKAIELFIPNSYEKERIHKKLQEINTRITMLSK